jgi:mRNA interferase MazF
MQINNGLVEIFINWTKLKIRLHISERQPVYFREKEIWWASLGANIGYEQDGKNDKFERPILVLKKFSKDILWALPLTSKDKTGEYYYQFEYNRKKYSVILSQIRLISSKRLLRKVRVLSDVEFEKVRNKFKNLV